MTAPEGMVRLFKGGGDWRMLALAFRALPPCSLADSSRLEQERDVVGVEGLRR